jgi:hypothetical protein
MTVKFQNPMGKLARSPLPHFMTLHFISVDSHGILLCIGNAGAV